MCHGEQPVSEKFVVGSVVPSAGYRHDGLVGGQAGDVARAFGIDEKRVHDEIESQDYTRRQIADHAADLNARVRDVLSGKRTHIELVERKGDEVILHLSDGHNVPLNDKAAVRLIKAVVDVLCT